MTLNFHVDPGHGWLEVTTADLDGVGLKPTDFSRFSYRDGDRCFLEEDCDATKFIEKFIYVYGREPTPFHEIYHRNNAPMRSMRPSTTTANRAALRRACLSLMGTPS